MYVGMYVPLNRALSVSHTLTNTHTYTNTHTHTDLLCTNTHYYSFFSSLYAVLKRDAKAILQFYPENAEQVVLIAQAASRVGFAGGVLVDYPNSTKAKKYFLCLSFERSYQIPDAKGIGGT